MIAFLGSIAPFLPLILQVISFIVGKNSQNVALQNAFLSFTNEMAKAGLISVNLHNSFAQQVNDNAKKAADKYAAEQAAKQAPPKA